MADFQTILVATDLSDPSLAAVDEAGELCRRLGCRLLVLHVMENRLPLFLSDDEVAAIQARHRRHAEHALGECIAARLAGVDTEPVILEGEAHEAIVRLARERDASMIVVGMQGHGFLKHALAGSVAERVLHGAPCPVLVVAREHRP